MPRLPFVRGLRAVEACVWFHRVVWCPLVLRMCGDWHVQGVVCGVAWRGVVVDEGGVVWRVGGGGERGGTSQKKSNSKFSKNASFST